MPRKSIRQRIAAHKGEGQNACGGPKLSGLVSKMGRPISINHLFKSCCTKYITCARNGCPTVGGLANQCKTTSNQR
tara:strand:- start:734 stop:961 length:228 start_codon:yes stop_codon:yes gene_type:complete